MQPITDLAARWTRQDLSVRGIRVAHWVIGAGTPLVMVHGVGPGTNGLANFGPVLEALSQKYELHLTDLIGFGASGQKTERPFFDPAIWQEQVAALVAACSAPPVLVGNSMGAALTLKIAARGGITKAIAIGAPAAKFTMPAALRRFWALPASAAALAAAMKPMTSRQSEPAESLVAARLAILADPAISSYFGAMMDDATQEMLETAALTAEEADKISVPVTIVYGRDDRACPPDLILPGLSKLLPAADIIQLGSCGHNVSAERTDDLISIIDRVAGR